MASYTGTYVDSLGQSNQLFLVKTYTIRDGIRSETSKQFDLEYLPSSYFQNLNDYDKKLGSCSNPGIVKPRQIVIHISNNLDLYATLIHPEGSEGLKKIWDDLDLANAYFSIYGETLSSGHIYLRVLR